MDALCYAPFDFVRAPRRLFARDRRHAAAYVIQEHISFAASNNFRSRREIHRRARRRPFPSCLDNRSSGRLTSHSLKAWSTVCIWTVIYSSRLRGPCESSVLTNKLLVRRVQKKKAILASHYFPCIISFPQDIVTPPPPLPTPVAGGTKGPSPLVSGASLASIVVADVLLKRAFLRAGLTFPASLAGMVGLFAGEGAVE